MKNSKSILLAVAIFCLLVLGAALYLQHFQNMPPCPLCVIQRYSFSAIALICLVCAGLPVGAQKAGIGLSLLAALSGIATAIWQLWIIAHPSSACGREILEGPMNSLPPATWLPSVFQVDAYALCSTVYDPIMGLSIPQWSLLGFVILLIILVATLCKRQQN